jgi:hypothetical protein
VAEGAAVADKVAGVGPAQPVAITRSAAAVAEVIPRSAMIVPYPKKPANRCGDAGMNSILSHT